MTRRETRVPLQDLIEGLVHDLEMLQQRAGGTSVEVDIDVPLTSIRSSKRHPLFLRLAIRDGKAPAVSIGRYGDATAA